MSALSFGASMMFVRLGVVNDAPLTLMIASTIATRYSAIRRQSPIGDDTSIEPQIMDHLTQQAKVLPQIAKTIAFKLISDNAWNLYTDVMKEIKVGNFNNLPELHAITCGLKAILTSDVVKGVEILRLACGGHGYADYSNMPSLYCNNVSMS
uniref:Acyl-CoA oxidase C-alpha1 domain-containing protein n=1 Tax=Megaselia scalaris TaxID=36166 RepID=T1H2Z6_MEGSC